MPVSGNITECCPKDYFVPKFKTEHCNGNHLGRWIYIIHLSDIHIEFSNLMYKLWAKMYFIRMKTFTRDKQSVFYLYWFLLIKEGDNHILGWRRDLTTKRSKKNVNGHGFLAKEGITEYLVISNGRISIFCWKTLQQMEGCSPSRKAAHLLMQLPPHGGKTKPI